MKVYTVSRLAKLAGVSVRTLHHYDETGLLKPSFRSESGYRQYQREDLLRLQQILFYRELDFSLSEIKDILDDPEYDEVQALVSHRQSIEQRIERLSNLLAGDMLKIRSSGIFMINTNPDLQILCVLLWNIMRTGV